MERDFLGLSSKEPVILVKEEVANDVFKEIGFTKGSGIQGPFSNKVTAVPQFLSFKVAQEDKTKKVVSDPSGSSGFMPLLAADAYEHNQRRSMGEVQKSINHDGKGGTPISLTSYSGQHEVHSLHRSHDIKTFPVSNQAISLSINNPFFRNHFATMGQNVGDSNVNQQLLGGIPVAASYSILPSIGSVGAVTESWNNVKGRGSPQLTIFYAGKVNVFEEISPEKAQAIMSLAGNGGCIAAQSKVQVHAPSSGLTPVVGVTVNTPPCTVVSSSISLSSHTGAQSGSGSTTTEEPMAAKTTAVATTPICKLRPQNIVKAVGSVAATAVAPAGFPQARKASLALFLEKRKQRAMNAAPYPSAKTPQKTHQKANLM